MLHKMPHPYEKKGRGKESGYVGIELRERKDSCSQDDRGRDALDGEIRRREHERRRGGK